MQTAFFLDSRSGRLFCTGFLHTAPVARRKFLILAPFGEEMNKSRHVLSALVRSLGEAGNDVLLPDLYGTGDSAGDFGDASIDSWRTDIAAVIDHLAGDGGLHLIGMRAGALLAADASRRHPIRSLTLIHPVADGRQQLNQLLRLRLAGGLTGQTKQETAADLREELAAGNSLEIAGYRLSSDMASGLESLTLATMIPEGAEYVHWVELVKEPDRPMMPASQRVIDEWIASGLTVTTDTVTCDTFWATQEIAQCPAVVEAVVRHLEV